MSHRHDTTGTALRVFVSFFAYEFTSPLMLLFECVRISNASVQILFVFFRTFGSFYLLGLVFSRECGVSSEVLGVGRLEG